MKVRNLLFGFVLSILVLCASVAENKASAAACSSLPVYTYYTDATYTVVCGVWDICSGTYPECWTDYRTSVRKLCCNPQ